MAENELQILMRLCSQRGFQEWRDADTGLKDAAAKCLPGRIVESGEIQDAIHGETGRLYVPMPLPPGKSKSRKSGHRGFERCFFCPKNSNGQLVSLILFLLINLDGKCLVLRFETDHGQDTTHGYSHVQLTKRDEQLDFPCTPNWLPDSYPAVPVPACNPLDLFLSMMTAVYGFPSRIDTLIMEVFRETARAKDVHLYLERLKSMLCVSKLDADS